MHCSIFESIEFHSASSQGTAAPSNAAPPAQPPSTPQHADATHVRESSTGCVVHFYCYLLLFLLFNLTASFAFTAPSSTNRRACSGTARVHQQGDILSHAVSNRRSNPSPHRCGPATTHSSRDSEALASSCTPLCIFHQLSLQCRSNYFLPMRLLPRQVARHQTFGRDSPPGTHRQTPA
jgi:hypothetical protein